MAARQTRAEFSDGGVVGGQLLQNLHCPAVLDLRLRPSARLLQQDAEAAVASGTNAWNSVIGGLAWRPASRRSLMPGGTRPPPPSDGLFVLSSRPRLWRLPARLVRNWG